MDSINRSPVFLASGWTRPMEIPGREESEVRVFILLAPFLWQCLGLALSLN